MAALENNRYFPVDDLDQGNAAAPALRPADGHRLESSHTRGSAQHSDNRSGFVDLAG
jgi:hypothetical protein